MADIILCPLLQVIFDKVASGLLKMLAINCGFEEEINKLRHTLNVIRAVVEDAEERQVKEKALKIWLAELKEVAYDVDNLLDEFGLDAILARRRSVSMITVAWVGDIFPFLKPFAAYLELFQKLKDIRNRLGVLASERHDFRLKEWVVVERGSDFEGKRQTGSFVIESEVIGREEDREAMIELLAAASNGTSGFSRKMPPIIPIVGLGGIGKTTLAQLVYNDERVVERFELKIWVCVNEDFSVRKIMKLIIESVTMSKCDFLGMDVLQSQLRRLLHGRRYLLVLDDVWNEDHEEWDKLRISLNDGVEGSKVIVTTRSAKVASMVGTIFPYYLKGLSHDDCWELFKQRAFGPEEECQNLLPIGKEIVKKCGGIPLAAKVLGSLMRFKGEVDEWLRVQESELWNVVGENRILPALRLSYSHLPSHLKCCFTYCSVFPKNYLIKKDNLIHLWIAEGLIRSNDERKLLEDIGNDYFNDLMWMFFFQDVEKDDDGNVLECKMHDLIHDLAQSVVGDEFVILEHGHIPTHLAQTRHTSVVCDSEMHTIPESLYEAKKLRTFNLLFSKGDLGEAPLKLFSSFRYLRTLNLSSCGIKKLHSSISCLISLRHLNISNTPIERLPESVCDLGNLQVLNLSDCCDLIELPGRLAFIIQLRHLMIYGCCRLSQFPDNIGRLIQLQTLPIFIIGTEIAQGLKQLRFLPLAGELKVKQLKNVKPGSDAVSACLRRKPKLRSLGLSWGNNHDDLIMQNDEGVKLAEEVLDSLQPHQNLKRLSIEGYSGDYFPRWIGSPELPNLTNVELINCKRSENVPALGQLPFLRIVYMHGMHSVKNIGSGFYGIGSGRPFQSLKELSLIDFPNLEFWWSMNTKEEFPLLVKLIINKCPRLKNLPNFPSLQHLELRNGNEMILKSAINLSTLLNLVIDGFTGRLVVLERLLENNPRLISLTISSCHNLCSLSSKLGGLVSLKSLAIRWCQELVSLPQEIQNLSSLDYLEISECHSIAVLPEGIEGLSSLQSLSIENCDNLTSIPRGLENLTALEHFTIMYCPSLASLPANFRNLNKLKSFGIFSCPRLAFLPEELQHVTTLQRLEIHSCPAFKELPEWIGNLSSLTSLKISDCRDIVSLPESLQLLTSLQHLSISECPRLENRCKKYIGEDWPKVAHIPHTYIGSTEPKQHNNASSSSSSR